MKGRSSLKCHLLPDVIGLHTKNESKVSQERKCYFNLLHVSYRSCDRLPRRNAKSILSLFCLKRSPLVCSLVSCYFIPAFSGPSISCPAVSCPVIWSVIFTSCNFMPCTLVLQFHVLQFHALQIGPSISRPSFSRPAFSAPPAHDQFVVRR